MDTKTDQAKRKRLQFPDAVAHLIFWPIVVVGTAADLWSKSAVFQWLGTKAINENIGYEYVEHVIIEGFFNFIMRENKGAAWSIASGQTTLLVTFSVVAFIAVMGLFLFGGIKHRLMQVGLGLFAAGILGNLYDRMYNDGGVRDFIDVTIPVFDYRWPTFNIADSLLCIAVGVMLIANFRASTSETPDHPQK